MRRIVELLILVLCLAVLPAAAQSILPDSLAGWSAGPTSAFLSLAGKLCGKCRCGECRGSRVRIR